jgi:hypothetical protein
LLAEWKSADQRFNEAFAAWKQLHELMTRESGADAARADAA